MKQIIRIFFFLFCLFSISKSWGQLPSLNFGNNGNANGCAPHTVVFSISNVSSNTANTSYQLNFGDGSPVLNYTQTTIPATVSHTYASISCGQTFSGQQNCFGATLTSTNTSGPTSGAVFPIRISKKPNASITLSSSSKISGSNITFTNISDPGVTYTGTTCNTNPPYFWAVTGPSAGTVVSGTLGSNNTFPANINAWTPGSSPLTMQFTTPGSYQMKLSTGNSCGVDDTTLNFEVFSNACLLSVQDVNYCNTNSAVLGVGMQLTLASLPITNTITSYSWTGPNGFTSNSQYPIVPSPVSPGNYTLTIQAPGCVSNASDNIINVSTTSSNCPTAAFTASPAVVCDGATTTFTNQTTGSGNSYFWLFGDGTTSTSANPTHVYDVVEGTGTVTFTATLVVTNAAGRMDIVEQVITVRQIPAEPTITSPQLTTYNSEELLRRCVTSGTTGNVSISSIVSSAGSWQQSIQINWGDGMVQTISSFPAIHTYSLGYYTFTIEQIGPNGCIISNSYPVFIGNTPQFSVPLVIDNVNCLPHTVNLSLSNISSNISGTTYSVVYSDGSPIETFNHPPPSFIPHTFDEVSCTYQATVGVNVFSDAFSIQVSAQNVCGANFGAVGPFRIAQAPTASFTALPTPVCINNTVTVNSTADLGNNIDANGCNTNHGMVWSISPATGWSLTSGTLGGTNGQPTNYFNWTNGSNQLSLIFFTPGNYTISQRIRNSCGEDVETNSVLITANSNIVDAGVDQSVCLGSAPLQLTGTPSGGTWSGSAAVNLAGVFNPTAIGTYTLTYTFGSGSCSSSDQKVVTVYAPPTVSVNDPTICSGNQAVLTAFGSGGLAPYTYAWSPTAGLSAATGASVTTSPTASTSYTVTVSDARSCTATDVSNINVNPIPTVDAGSNVSICNGSTNNTLIGNTPTGGAWSGVGVTSAGVFTPTALGNVTLTYSVTQTGCTGTDQIIVSVVSPVIPNAGIDQSLCIGSSPVLLNGIPSGGIWSGNSLVNSEGVFSPNTVGSYSLVYSIGVGSCLVSDELNIQVIALPIVAFALEDTLFCTSDAAITLISGTPAGGVYFGSGVNGNQFDPSLTFVGESTIGYSYTDFNGCSNLVNENIAVEICALISNSDKSKVFHVYPNPSSGILNIQLQEGCLFAEMSLFSLDGKLITQKQLSASSQSFDFSVLSSGVYFIQLQNKEEIISLPWYKFN